MSSSEHMTAAAVIGRGRILTGAMAVGVLVLTAIGVVLGPIQPDSGLLNGLRIGLVVLAASTLLVMPLVRKAALAKLKQKVANNEGEDREELTAGAYLTFLVLGNALIEGVGLLAAVSVLLTGDWLGLAVALSAIILLIQRLPSQGRYRAFVDAAGRPWS